MRYLLIVICFFSQVQYATSQTLTPFEKDTNHNITPTYQEVIAFYDVLAKDHTDIFQFQPYGNTDSGYPLHLGVLSRNGDFDVAKIKADNKLVIFINNAIHPGEPCGVDATMMMTRDFLEKRKNHPLPEDVVIVFVPFYNIGGGLNRGGYSRANQVGPQAHGFRGNAKHLDLNRDFIKTDSENAQTFNQLYTQWHPDIFIDNHTSNGADYQYVLTLIPTQHNKLSAPLANYLNNTMLPYLFEDMPQRGYDMTPYVNARNTPDEGIYGFLDLPRYSSGYAALHHAISFMPETHMLKPFKDRVQSVYQFMQSAITVAIRDKSIIQAARIEAISLDRKADSLAINWTLDLPKYDTLSFKGYEHGYKPSAISGIDRLFYDRSKPYTKSIPHFNYYKATEYAHVPKAYVIPQAYSRIMERMKNNGVKVEIMKGEGILHLAYARIDDYDTGKRPYEGHYLHNKVKVTWAKRSRAYRPGDFVIYTDQPAIRYIVETLEPTAPDSYFAWNFFDAILQQKEYFSSYVFEDTAAEYLKQNPDVKEALDKKKSEDPEFAKNGRAQLDFIYKRSPYYEYGHMLYPVGKYFGEGELETE